VTKTCVIATRWYYQVFFKTYYLGRKFLQVTAVIWQVFSLRFCRIFPQISNRLLFKICISRKTCQNAMGWNWLSNFSRPGSGRGGEQQYNAWDRSSRPGSGRGLNNSSASPGCVSASSNSSTPSMSPTSPSSSSAGGQLGLVPEHRIRNIVPPTNLPIVPGSKNCF
jgi:hypothetical protein